MSTRMHRRSFLRTASAAAAGVSLPCLIPSHVLGGPDRPGANERVNVGIIGLGGRATDIARTCFSVPQVRLAAVCDCFLPRCKDFAKRIDKPQTWKTYEDFRQMIAKEKLDGVMVETTTHARAWIAILAMQAGMDAYIEKPMCLTIAEGRAMVKAARKYNRVTQVGTQQRSMPINNWASDLVKNGALGKVLTVIAPNFVGPGQVDRPARRAHAQGRAAATGGTSGPTRPSLRPYHSGCTTAGTVVGLRRRRPLLRRHRLGHPFLRPDQPRPGHRRHRPARICLEEPVKVMATGKYAPKLRPAGLVGQEDTGTRLPRHGQARTARGRRSP